MAILFFIIDDDGGMKNFIIIIIQDCVITISCIAGAGALVFGVCQMRWCCTC